MTVDNLQSNRQQFINDYHRPRYHYLPPNNWMNDPNGVIQWDNCYHLFYQYNPLGAYHANMHWGHAVSDDLIHWEDLPIAIAPTPNSVDEGGIFSGCIVNDSGVPKMLYTGVNPDYSIQTQCLAIGDDDLLTWQKYAANPVIGTVPDNMQQTSDFRDPFVWQEDDSWFMVVGSRIDNVGGAILLYQSHDLVHWEYLNPLLVGDIARTGYMWECPNFFPIGDKWVLIISSHIGHTTGTVMYFVGDYANYRFIPQSEGVLDAGYYYAPLTHLDNKNRRLMYGWVREGRSIETQIASGWSGMQAIPRVLSLDDQNRLTMQPIDELKMLRGKHYHFTNADVEHGIVSINSNTLEIRATFDITQNPECGIVLAASADFSEQTRIIYDTDTQTLRVHRQYANVTDDLDTYWQGIVHILDPDEPLDLLILLDGSVLEIIANQRRSLTSRIYAQSEDSQHIHIINLASLHTLDIWEMSSIW